jgi:hypothetical protein
VSLAEIRASYYRGSTLLTVFTGQEDPTMSARISRTLVLLAVLSSTAGVWPHPIVAQRSGSAGASAAMKVHAVSLFVGGLYTRDELPLNAGLNTGFRYTQRAFKRLWLELETGLGFTNEADSDGLLGHAQLQARWYPFSPARPVDPFLLVGVGAVGYNTVGDSEGSPVIVLGLGVELDWLEGVGFRLDAGDYWMTDMLGESSHNFRVSWGPVFWF